MRRAEHPHFVFKNDRFREVNETTLFVRETRPNNRACMERECCRLYYIARGAGELQDENMHHIYDYCSHRSVTELPNDEERD